MEWTPWRRGGPLDLRTLWEVEEQMSPQLRWEFHDALLLAVNKERALYVREHGGPDMWPALHADAPTRITALAAVLRPLVEAAT